MADETKDAKSPQEKRHKLKIKNQGLIAEQGAASGNLVGVSAHKEKASPLSACGEISAV
ncbi:hypothetical protein [Mixta calida]|uniref:hypothetical protein n=1 Tax=Mixta calida TaxID=665913 RepID=UPI00403AED59